MSLVLANAGHDAAPSQQEGRHTALVARDDFPPSQNAAAVYLARLAPGSERTMRAALNSIAHLLTNGRADAFNVNWPAVRYQHVAAIRAKLAASYKPATANKMLSALRGVLRECWRLSQMPADEYQRAADVESVTGTTLPAGRALTAGEIAALLNACANDETPAGARDAAMIALLRAGGLRRAELCALMLADFNPANGELMVTGKRNKERVVFVSGGAAEALADWLAVRGDEAGALFCPINKGGRLLRRKMQAEAVFNVLQKRALEAGISHLSPHDLRRTFAGDLLDAGADIATVQKLMGHANVNTTARYDRRGDEAKRKAVELLHVPYHRRAARVHG